MNLLEKKLFKKLNSYPEIELVTPGVVVDIHYRGKRKGLVHFGRTYPYYDLASLTKIIFTASASLYYFDQVWSDLFVPIFPKISATPFELLTHTAGFEWWIPMYKKLNGPVRFANRWPQLVNKILIGASKYQGPKGRKAVYSDLDLWLMGAFLEERTDKTLLELWDDVRSRMNYDDIFFHVDNRPKFSVKKYAPTEKCPWRGRVLQGEVHDENAWSFGGVAPHAGLFGNIESVSAYGLELRAATMGEKTRLPGQDMVKYFTGRRIPREVGDWGLGFMKPSSKRASAGKYFSLKSFGHTGFTGTSLWFDPVQDLLVVILSNRVHPTRDNARFVKLRPKIHDWIYESICL